jgi:hypothetical protein
VPFLSCLGMDLVLRTAIAPPVWRGGSSAILLAHRTETLVENFRRAPLGAWLGGWFFKGFGTYNLMYLLGFTARGIGALLAAML